MYCLIFRIFTVFKPCALSIVVWVNLSFSLSLGYSFIRFGIGRRLELNYLIQHVVGSQSFAKEPWFSDNDDGKPCKEAVIGDEIESDESLLNENFYSKIYI